MLRTLSKQNAFFKQTCFRFSTTTPPKEYECIIVKKKDGNVAQITLNRPKDLNALCW